jgi:hypothetical protein
MAPTHYDDIIGWTEIKEWIMVRDGYTCQGCKIEEGTITFPKQKIYPRYAEQQGELFVFLKPVVRKVNKFLAATPENIRTVDLYRNHGTRSAVERYPYHFSHLAETIGTDGFELLSKVQTYLKENPHKLERVRPVRIGRVKINLTVHHIDGNSPNNADENFRTLCHWCHQEAHQDLFKPVPSPR